MPMGAGFYKDYGAAQGTGFMFLRVDRKYSLWLIYGPIYIYIYVIYNIIYMSI